MSTITPPSLQLGVEVPYAEPHALSVSLPTWSDNVGWASKNEAIINAMSTGYPRFFIHRKILELSDICLKRSGATEDFALLFPTAHAARELASFMQHHAPSNTPYDFNVQVVLIPTDFTSSSGRENLELYAFALPPELRKLGRQFWQHTGMGITSRYAEACLANLDSPNVYYSDSVGLDSLQPASSVELHPETKRITQVLQRRIASLAYSGKLPDESDGYSGDESLGVNGHDLVSESDVFLYPSGMSAIWHAHQLIMKSRPGLKSICFGFPYLDTLKVIEKWGPGCIFFGNHPDTNLADLETFLQSTKDSVSIAALFCELPSNPLIRSPNLPRLRELADEHGFPIVIDDTIGTSVNVNVLQYVDIVVTSLSKMFSGKADVLGGSLVLNPKYRHHAALKNLLASSYANDYFLPDLARMEANSQDVESRVHSADVNTRVVCRYLRSRTLAKDAPNPISSSSEKLAIKNIFYPEWETRQNYDQARRPGRDDNFGHLFTLYFVSLRASQAFYDALSCPKGPTLGTNFTLGCAYTLLSHYSELEWAAGYGIEEGLVRVSVGMEDLSVLLDMFEKAVKAAERAIAE